MDLASIEELIKRAAGAVMADLRVVRRILKHDRGVHGLSPHARCCTIAREKLLAFVEPYDIGGADATTLPPEVIVLARPSPRELQGGNRAQIITRLWRAVFHARVHQAIERRSAAGALDEAELRKRIDRIGQTEFDEVRSILRHDDLVLPPHGDREVYTEFAALYLELRYFAPNLLITTFPGLGAYEVVEETLALDVEAGPLLQQGLPGEVELPRSKAAPGSTSAPSFSMPVGFGFVESLGSARILSQRRHARLLRAAAAQRQRGNDVRAALLCVRAAGVEGDDERLRAERDAREAVMSLGKRLQRALRGRDEKGRPQPDWSALLFLLADRAAAERGIGPGPEARMLYGLQRAAMAHERGQRIVDVAGSFLSWGERKVVRRLPATRELLVARHIQAAARRLRNVRLGGADRKLLAKLLAWASERADANVRVALRRRIHRVLDKVGLRARSTPETLARDKLAEELLDEAVKSGFLSFGSLRDALSRNQLKLEDIDGAYELLDGDPLLKADRELAIELDGIYQRGDIYIRGLQKVSSIPFGTRLGRLVTLWCVLPLGGAYVILAGIGHIVSDVLGWFGRAPIDPLTPASFGFTAALILALIHSAPFRAFAWQMLEVLGLVLATLFFRLPRALFARPAVRRWLARPGVRLVLRRMVIPAIVAALCWWLIPVRRRDEWLGLAFALTTFAATSAVMGSRLGSWAEDFVVDQLAPTWQVLSRQWIPGLLRLIQRFFTALMDLVQRGIYRVDELLRYREGESRVALVLKGAVGLVWAMFAYVVRLIVTLFVEPEINPLKHFPVVTVAHKITLGIMAKLFETLMVSLSFLGSVVAGAIAGVTVYLLPSVFGFLAWELKENYRLYRATRAEHLGNAAVGPHGESMRGLLVVGFHSGTVPKLYERLRRAAQREDEQQAASALLKRTSSAMIRSEGLGRFREGIREVELSVRRFVERELCTPLVRCARWRVGGLGVARVDLSSNRVRVKLRLEAKPALLCELTFEEQSGYIVAGIAEPGFVAELTDEALLLLENALAGLYHRADVDLVREQIEAELGDGVHYDIADEGLIVWPGRDYRTELVYPIGGRRRGTLPPKVRGADPAEPPVVLDTQQLMFSAQSISWVAWVAAWTTADHETAPLGRLVQGASILPDAPTWMRRSSRPPVGEVG